MWKVFILIVCFAALIALSEISSYDIPNLPAISFNLYISETGILNSPVVELKSTADSVALIISSCNAPTSF